MKKKIRILCFLVVFILFSEMVNSNVYAEDVQEFSSETLAVSLVIDTSGSMRESDAENLRLQAADIFLDLLSQDDYIGMINFNTQAKEVIPLQMVSGSNNRSALKKVIQQQTAVTGDTDYKLALDAAMNQLNQIQDDTIKKVIVFLSDGDPEPDPTQLGNMEFMDAYMNGLWESVDAIAGNNCPIYTIGFSDGIRTDILSKMAEITDGSYKVLPDSSSLAGSFFEILGELKNRKIFMKETTDIEKTYQIQVPMDEYTSQATLVVKGDNTGQYLITAVGAEGENVEGYVETQQGTGYTIITLNHESGVSNGTWVITLRGNGQAEIYGNRDINIQSSLITPSSESKYQKGQNVAIKLFVTGEIKEGITASALITDSYGNTQVIDLENKDNFFQGNYTATQTYGTYTIEVGVMLNGEILTSKKEAFSVNVVPKLNTSVYLKQEGYRIGETIPIRAWMSIANTRLTEGEDLQINILKAQIVHSNNTISEIELINQDNTGENEDTGIWSGIIDLKAETIANIKLIADGIYKGENFVIEQEIGDYAVKPAGEIVVEIPETQFYAKKGKTIEIPLILQNNSDFEETLQVSYEGIPVTLEVNQFVLSPKEKKEITLYFVSNEDTTIQDYPVTLYFASINPWTLVSTQEADMDIDVLSTFGTLVRNIANGIKTIQVHTSGSIAVIIGVICTLILLFVVLGIVFYKKLYLTAQQIGGTLEYKNQLKSESILEKLNFDLKGQKKIVISFDKKNPDADYYIPDTNYSYDLIFTAGLKRTHIRMLAGWKTFLLKKIPVKYKITATAPGIITKRKEVFTSKILQDDDEFESGGYYFHYSISQNRWNEKKIKGQDLLEGRYEEGKGL